MKLNIKQPNFKLKFKLIYIYYILIVIILVSIALTFNLQSRQIQQFRQEQIQRNNLISKEYIEEPVLDGLKPQIININNSEQTLYLPDKFKIDVLTKGLKSPQFIESDDKDNLFVTDNKANALWVISEKDRNNPKIVDSKLNGVTSIFYYNGLVYIATENKIIRYTDIQSDGSYKEKKILIDNLPKPKKDLYHTIIVHNNRIYIGISADCESCQPRDKRLGSIMSYSIDGKDEKLFARGVKQISDMQVYDNKLIVTDIGRLNINNQMPMVEINKIEEGKDYGWPYCYGYMNIDPKYTEKSDFCKNKAEPPITELPKGTGVAGLSLIPNNFYKNFTDNYVFIYQGGQQNSIPKGYKVVIKDIYKNSATKNFITGWLLENGNSWGSPKGVTFDNKGAMIITDQKNGLLYKVIKE